MPEHLESYNNRLMRIARLARYSTAILLLGLFIATHTPREVIPHDIAAADKFAHCFAYMAIAFSALTSWELSIGLLRPPHYFMVWLIGTLYGAFDEITQIPVGRHCDGLDWLADMLGIVLGLTLFRLARPLIYWLARQKPAANTHFK